MDFNYQISFDKVFNDLIKKEKTRRLNKTEKSELQFPKSLDVLEVKTEFYDENELIRDICFHIVFPADYPLYFPKIFVSPDDFDKIKFIPHLQVDRMLCIFQNYSYPDINQPEKVVEEALTRAKSIIQKGLKKNNFNDFDDEFESYWSYKYALKDSVEGSTLIINEKALKDTFEVLILNSHISGYSSIIHQNEPNALLFINYLKFIGVDFKSYEGLLIEEFKLFDIPPYHKTNREILEYIEKNHFTQYEIFLRLINDSSLTVVILF